MIISLIVAMTREYIIGNKGALPWHTTDVPGELRLFQSTTYDHTVIMGRKTWSSLPPRSRPLMRRHNIILTRNPSWRPASFHFGSAGLDIMRSLEAALDDCRHGGDDEVFVIGGAEVFRAAYPYADRIYLTLIERQHAGDTYFPCPIFDDPWRWQPDPVKGHGWTRHILCKITTCTQGTPMPNPTEDLHPAADDAGQTRPMKPTVSTRQGNIVVEQPPYGPGISPGEVRAAIDLWLLLKQRDLLPENAPLTLDTFAAGCWETATYPGAGHCLLYPLLGWVNELGEALEVITATFNAAALTDSKAIYTSLLLLAVQVGKVAGLVKKAYRNVDPAQQTSGVLTADALKLVREELDTAVDELDDLRCSLEFWSPGRDRVELPPVELTPEQKDKFGREAGDALWYPMVALTEAGLRADTVGRSLLAKLRHRAAAGTLRSTGDDESTRAPGAD